MECPDSGHLSYVVRKYIFIIETSRARLFPTIYLSGIENGKKHPV
jgi:hypothetical protein